jgi:hypothetical protein
MHAMQFRQVLKRPASARLGRPKYVSVIPQLKSPNEAHRRQHLLCPTCYVEVMSFKFIHVSAFVARWRWGMRVAAIHPGPALGKKLGIDLG